MLLKFTNMVRLLFFIFVIIIIGGSEGLGIMPLREYEVVHVVDNHNTCSRHETRLCVDAFVNCFVNRKYRNRSNLFNIVPRLLDRSKTCIKFANRECRPSYDGFIRIMGKVIDMIKAYSSTHVERLVNARIITSAEKDKIKDLNCVENSLTKDTYTTCFDSVISTYEDLLDESETYDLIFQKEVEKAIICTNIANTQCSKSVRIELNKIVRCILGVRHTEVEDIQNDRKSFEIPTPNEPGKLSSETKKSGQDDIDDDFETSELPDSTSHPNSTDFTVIEQEKIEVVLKIKRPSETPDFPEEKIDDPKPKNVGSHETEPTPFAERTTFSEPTTFTDPPKPEKENSENDTNLPEETEITVTPVASELSTSTKFPETVKLFNSPMSLNPIRKDNDLQFTEPPQLLKTTQSSKQNISDSIGLDNSKDINGSEKGKDIMIDLSDWEEESTVFTEPPQPLMTTESPNLKDLQNSTVFNVSTDGVAAETKKEIIIDRSDDKKSTTFTAPPLLLMNTESSKLTDLPNSTGLDASKGRVTSRIEEDITVDLSDEEISTTLTEHPQLLMTTESPKIKDLRNSTGLDTPKIHTAAKTGKDIVTESVTVGWEAKLTASTKLPKPSDLPKSTASTVPLKHTDFSKSTASTKLPKPTDLPKSAAPTRSSKPTDLPKSTSSTKPPKTTDLPKSTAPTTPRKTTDLPKSTAPTKSRKTTDLPKSTAPTTPRKTTDLPKSTTTTRRPTPPAPVQLRSRNTPYDPPRPTEAPKHWYDFIVQPFVSLWRTIKSWFGY